MDDVWFGPGLTSRDYESFLQALSLQAKDQPPLLAVSRRDESGATLLVASRSLFRLFGVSTAEDLSARLLDGADPGAKRLLALSDSLPLQGAPRLERLRFFVGPGSEIITFLCRRIHLAERPVFIAAALGVRPGLIPAPGAVAVQAQDAPLPVVEAPAAAEDPPVEQSPGPTPSMNVQAIQAALHARWPSQRNVRFLWQTDAGAILTFVTPSLADIVGTENADVIGRDFTELAPTLDPSGRLQEALASQKTWSGIEAAWPIAGASATVKVGLGAMPAVDRDGTFAGYRGFGVVHTDQISSGKPVRFKLPETPGESVKAASHNVVRFPGNKALSPEDQEAFQALGSELRDQAGLNEAPPPSPVEAAGPPKPPPEAIADPSSRDLVPPAAREPAAPASPALDSATPNAPPQERPTAAISRNDDVARNGLAILDRLAVGILVSRTNIPIFANRHLLDLLGFADEDALHEAGGMSHLFGGVPGNVSGSEAVGVRSRDGTINRTHARMQSVDWDGLPATLLTLQPIPYKADRDDEGGKRAPASARDGGDEAAATTRPADDAAERHQQELRELRAILETATDGVAVMDSDCNVLSLNRSGEALFGCDRGTVIGKPFLSLFAPDNQGLAAEYLEGLKSNATKSLLNDGREFLVKTHQGGIIPVFMTLGRLGSPTADASDPAPKGPRFCALFRDLTHWKKVEQDLESARQNAERASALKSDFLTKVSHEIRTPLNAIIGFAEVIMEERFGPIGSERYKEYLRDIHGSGTHVMSLVNDLLDLSKIEAGRMELSVADVDINKIMSECVALMQPQASRERVIMRLSLAPGLPLIRADERSLRQIILNILSNAVKFNEPGGQVIVATAAGDGPPVVIRVRDTGLGMSDEQVAAALEPFRRVSTLPERGGTGLGLPLTKALAEANNASFAIRSKPEQGTLVEVAFPSSTVVAT